MSNISPFVSAQQIFKYLVDDYGFELTEAKVFESFGNWVMVLELEKKCRIRILEDRGEIFVSFGPAWSPPGWETGPWYDISVVLVKLGENSRSIPRDISNSIMQLEKYAQIVKPIIPQICNLFKGENYEKNRMGLEHIKNSLDEETWDKLLGKN